MVEAEERVMWDWSQPALRLERGDGTPCPPEGGPPMGRSGGSTSVSRVPSPVLALKVPLPGKAFKQKVPCPRVTPRCQSQANWDRWSLYQQNWPEGRVGYWEAEGLIEGRRGSL